MLSFMTYVIYRAKHWQSMVYGPIREWSFGFCLQCEIRLHHLQLCWTNVSTSNQPTCEQKTVLVSLTAHRSNRQLTQDFRTSSTSSCNSTVVNNMFRSWLNKYVDLKFKTQIAKLANYNTELEVSLNLSLQPILEFVIQIANIHRRKFAELFQFSYDIKAVTA